MSKRRRPVGQCLKLCPFLGGFGGRGIFDSEVSNLSMVSACTCDLIEKHNVYNFEAATRGSALGSCSTVSI
eukprot:4186049-Amphidinium_carterae.2